MVKYISNFRLVFSKENLQPRRKVIMRWSSARRKEKIPCKAWYLHRRWSVWHHHACVYGLL
jgi:hypothetical protein